MNIPVFHDDQHGTAIIVGAAPINAVSARGDKDIGSIKPAVHRRRRRGPCLPGHAGEPGREAREHLGGRPSRRGGRARTGEMDADKRAMRVTPTRAGSRRSSTAPTCSSASAPACSKPVMVERAWRSADHPGPGQPHAGDPARRGARCAPTRSSPRAGRTSRTRSTTPQPPIFHRGAPRCQRDHHQRAMKVACVRAIAALARRRVSDVAARLRRQAADSFGADYLIPTVRSAPPGRTGAGGGAGGDDLGRGHAVHRRPLAAYREETHQLRVPHRTHRETGVRARAGQTKRQGATPRARKRTVLRVQTVVDEIGLADLIGRPAVIEKRIRNASATAHEGPGVDFRDVVDINDDPRFNDYWQHYHRIMLERRGVTPAPEPWCARARRSFPR